jgi:hypothetical protein
MLSNVLLPDPDGPISATNSPRRTIRLAEKAETVQPENLDAGSSADVGYKFGTAI